MKRVLVLAYHFPPIGGGGVQRSLKFARYLPKLGYLPLVVTGPGSSSDRWTPRDRTLLDEIAPELEVRRLPTPRPPTSSRMRSRAERWLRLRTPFSRWWVEGAIATSLLATDSVALVYASMSPFESGETARQLARSLRLPWVADLRDPWALNEMIVYPTGLHRRLELRRMRTVLASASAIVMNTPEARVALLQVFPELAAKEVAVIPNGFDESDFDEPDPPRDPTVFRIVHAGSLHTDMSGTTSWRRRLLGGPFPGVEIGTRSHLYLQEAVERVVAERPELRRIFSVELVGELSKQDRDTIASSLVHAHGYLTHRETIDLMRQAALLFLPMHDLPEGQRATIVPGKTYEYLASGRPILAAVPDGDARDLLALSGNAFLCRPADVNAMAKIIIEQVDRFLAQGPTPTMRFEGIRDYERRQLTARLANVFDRVVTRSPELAPGSEPSVRMRTGADSRP